MTSAGTSLLFLIAFISAMLMGYAIQRGATCMVAALDRLVNGKPDRAIALLEASAIVAFGVVLARLVGLETANPATFVPGLGAILGGAMLGIGALVARACVFGSIARLGSGEWAYLLVPPGFLAGCFAYQAVGMDLAPVSNPESSIVIANAALFAVPLLLFAAWRLLRTWGAARQGMFGQYVWSPHVATGVIGVTFTIMFLTVGPWAYTELLSETARGMPTMIGSRGLLLSALLGGAILGGWTAGKLKMVAPSRETIMRCVIGGFLMGFGSMIVPGSNDGLILMGLPLLRLHAWLALASMAVSIIIGMAIEKRFSTIVTRQQKA